MSFDPVENQIREARERADVFASSLNKAREQEELFEEERQKWVRSFEEKSIMIEQLERELTSTVDALNLEKQEKSVVEDELVKSSWDVTNLSQSLDSANYRRGSQPAQNDSNNYKHVERIDAGASSRRVLELLQQSQEETSQARRELTVTRSERDRLIDQISAMKRQMDRLAEDRDELAKSIRNNDNKLQFRNEQVAEYALEKERNDRREIELMDFIDALEKQISSQRSDLAVAGTDLQAAAVHRTSLERRIEDLTRRASAPDSAALAHAASSSSLQARFDEMESIAVELTHRAESAESTLKMLMAAGGTTDAIINPRTSIVESTLINRNSFDGSVKVIAEPIIHSDNGRISTQNSVEIMQPNYEMGRFTVSEQGNDHNSRRNSILSQGDDSIYNRMRNQTQQQFQSVTDYTIPSAIPPEEDMQIRMPRPFLPTATPKKTSRKTKSKSGLDTSRSSIPGQGESLMSSRKKNSKLAESMESGDSRISADARKAYLLQNLSLGSDHGLVLVSRKDTKVATHRKIVPGKRVSTSATPTGSKGILRTSSVPAEISRQNAQYLRLSESVITATPRSVQSKSEKKPSRTKYVMSEKSVGERYDLKGRNGVGNVKFASSGPVRYVANTRSPAVSATKRPSSAVPVSKSTPSRGPTVIISDRDAGRYRPLVRL